MGLEVATYLDELVPTNPVGATDPKSQGDDHLRLIKSVLKETFPGLAGSAFRLQPKSSNYLVAATDNMTMLLCTATLTLTLPVATSLGNKHMFFVLVKGPSVTLVRSGADTINGLSSTSFSFNQSLIVFCDGTSAYHAMPLSGIGGGFVTGDLKTSVRTEASVEPGWIIAAGTIGDASSSATNRSNADCEALFTLLWNSWSNSQAAVSGGRGASAAADWAAHKRIAVPDLRGRVIAGKDNMLGTAANRLVTGLAGGTIGATGGGETHTLTQTEMPTHNHSVTDPGHTHSIPLTLGGLGGTGSGFVVQTPGPAATDSAITGITIGNRGSGDPHNNVQPTIAMNIFIKL